MSLALGRKRKRGDPLPKRGLAYKTLATILEPLGIPIIYSSPSLGDVQALPKDALFVILTTQHYLLGLRGSGATLIFDSLGLPEAELNQIVGKNLPFIRWNKRGYQSMFSTVCGYYIITIIQEIRRGSMIHSADVDKTLESLCKYNIEIPDTMPEWYRSHRLFDSQLKSNDKAVYDFVRHIYPDLSYIDKNSIHLPLTANALVGSPLFRHAGINPHSVLERYNLPSTVINAVDPQREWPGIGEATVSTLPGPVVPAPAPQKTKQQKMDEAKERLKEQEAAERVRLQSLKSKKLSKSQRQLEIRTQDNNAYRGLAGPGAEANPGQDPTPPQNITEDGEEPTTSRGWLFG